MSRWTQRVRTLIKTKNRCVEGGKRRGCPRACGVGVENGRPGRSKQKLETKTESACGNCVREEQHTETEEHAVAKEVFFYK